MPKQSLQVTTAGSVDDGKSTLLARLMLDSGAIFDDQLGVSFNASRIADLIDGLESERQQGITIDVAHRYVNLGNTRFHFKDAPGHEQYTRNMATAASGSDAVMLLVDVREGLKPQTRNHIDISLLMGIRQIAVLVTKLDLASYSSARFRAVESQVDSYLRSHALWSEDIKFVILPVSGLKGDNVVMRGKRLAWFRGPTLKETLLSFEPHQDVDGGGLAQVQFLRRLDGGGRVYYGQVMQGTLHKDSELHAVGQQVRFQKLWLEGQEATRVLSGDSFAFVLEEDIDLEVGHVISLEGMQPQSTFSATLIWFSQDQAVRGRSYASIIGNAHNRATVAKIRPINLSDGTDQGESRTLEVNAVARVDLVFQTPIFGEWPNCPGFMSRGVLVDPSSGDTVGAFIMDYPLRRSLNVTEHDFSVTRSDRELLTGQSGHVLWLTGLSGSGKSSIADALAKHLTALARPNLVLDGDSLRHGLNSDLGFSEADRSENIRRTAEVAKLIASAGIISIVCLVSPRKVDRTGAKEIVGHSDFTEVFVDTPLEICESRDPKGLYKRARRGEIPNFTGISAEFEPPYNPDVRIDGTQDVALSVAQLEARLASLD